MGKPFLVGYFGVWTRRLILGLALGLGAFPVLAQECPPSHRLSPAVPSLERTFNPNPSPADIELPMPCGAKLILRHVCVPADGFLGDWLPELGCNDCGRGEAGFMESRRLAPLAGSFTLQDLPGEWRRVLTESATAGDSCCLISAGEKAGGLYCFIGKYEITNLQWRIIMEDDWTGPEEPLAADDARPKTDVSWFEAVDFTRRYTEWLLANAPESLPKFSGGRTAYLRLPTEAEWEYAARGGHRVSPEEMDQAEFFPLKGRTYADYAVFTEAGAAKPPEKLAWIGSKCSNPLGLFDTAGNAAEMVLDPFHFSIGSRLHGATGGFVIKGGSFRKRRPEIMPGRREEMPFFLEEGAFRSTDLGFRVVLSTILTPQDRSEALKREWAAAKGVRPDSLTAVREVEPGSGQDPISELDRLAKAAQSGRDRESLFFLMDVIEESSVALAEQREETARGVILSAVLTAESVMNYTIRAKSINDWLKRVASIKKEDLVPSDLEWLEDKVINEKEWLEILEVQTESLIDLYLTQIRASREFSEETLLRQMLRLVQEIDLEDPKRRGLKRSLEMVREHLADSRGPGGQMSREVVRRDIIQSYYQE